MAVEDSFQSFVHPLLVKVLHNNDEAAAAPQQQAWRMRSFTRKIESEGQRPVSAIWEKHFILSAVRIDRQRIDGFCFGKVTQGLLAAHIQTDLTKKAVEEKRKRDAGVCTLASALSRSSLHFCWVSGKCVPRLRQSAENVSRADASTAACCCLSIPVCSDGS